MTDQLVIVERLRRLAARLSAGDADERWLGERLTAYFERARDGAALDQLLGLAAQQSARRWTTIQAQASRAGIVRQLAARYPGSLTAKARAVAGAVRAYESQCSTRDRRAQAMPAHYSGTARELLWQAFRHHGGLPSSARHILRILQGDCDTSSAISCHTEPATVSPKEIEIE